MKIRHAFPAEFRHLQQIEVASGEPFRSVGMPEIADDDPMPLAAMAECDVLVAVNDDDVPVAFAAVSPVDDALHIHQISVDPKWARQGIGAQLIAALGDRRLTLTTFRDVPWNAPYYARLGFVELTELTPGLAEIVDEEASRGFTGRVAMLLLPQQVPA
ncbi:GNAT family N-acetyltransferase [Lentzea tibetensis]|uniref:GNAT family N-acetyltransferase n=1 Tax=Lentzea tibetensis TaxID=2591470 RepID=A0A563EGZ8_9PSEU|nr:GNAT family N-acetyltransferase [Lentzea tibetensis]TWP45602.1 GNAT family N-acetyltransferase [Lentzea tibetensis]